MATELHADATLTIDTTNQRGAFVKTTATNQHAVTGYCAATSGTGSAGNFPSDNTAMSSLQVSGSQTGTGTIKVTHNDPGVADANAAALSIDVKGGSSSDARAVFITGTDGAPAGDVLVARYNSRDDFVIKSTGRVGIAINTAATPRAQLDVGGDGTLFLANVSGAPATPTGGGVLYVESGALKYKGSSGTVTTLGNA